MKKKQGGDRQVVRLGLRLLTRLFWWNRTASITTSNTRGVREIKTNRLRVGERVIFFFFLFFFLGGGGGGSSTQGTQPMTAQRFIGRFVTSRGLDRTAFVQLAIGSWESRGQGSTRFLRSLRWFRFAEIVEETPSKLAARYVMRRPFDNRHVHCRHEAGWTMNEIMASTMVVPRFNEAWDSPFHLRHLSLCVYVCVCVCVCVFFFRPIDGGPSNYGAVSFLFWRWNDSIEFREFFFISHPPSSPRPCCSIDRRAHLNLHRQITSMRSRKRQHWCIDRTGRALANTRKSLDQKSTRLRIKLDTTMPRFSFLIRQPIRCWSTLSVQFDDQGNESLWCGKLFHRFDWCTAAFVFACHLISLTLFIWNDIKRSNFKVWWSTSLFDSFLSPRETKRTGFWPSHCGLNGLLLTSMGVETLVWILLRK